MYWYKVWLKMRPTVTWYNKVACGYLEITEQEKEDEMMGKGKGKPKGPKGC